jgi:hypothetical protein
MIFRSDQVALVLGLALATLPASLEAQGGQPRTAGREEGDPATALFRRPRVMASQTAFRAYRETKPLAVSHAEFLSAGFVAGEGEVPLGSLVGQVSPEQNVLSSGRATLKQFTRIALAAPAGTSYGQGDSVLIVERREAPIGYGDVLVPTGVARITGTERGLATAEIIALYGPVRRGQLIAALPRFTDPGRTGTQSVAEGLEGQVLVARETRELRVPQQVLYIDKGQRDGVALGDIFEARGTPGEPSDSGVLPVDAIMATLKVVHVREGTASVKVLNVHAPHLPPGTRVKQIAKLGS